MKTENVFLADIDYEGSPHVRASLREDVVTCYTEVYNQNPDDMSRPDVFKIKDTPFYLVADGAHRLKAATAAGLKQVQCNVHEGTVDDCFMFALASNRQHGLQRTNEDKRACIETAIRKFPSFTDNRIAEACFVSNHLVTETRKTLEESGVVSPEPVREVADKGKKKRKRKSGTAGHKSNGRRWKEVLENSNNEVAEKVKEALSSEDVSPSNETSCGHLADEEGYPLTRTAAKYWSRRHEVQQILSAISVIKTMLMRHGESRDPLFHGISFNRAVDGLSDIYTNVANAKPYALCTECEGHPEIKAGGHCAMCGGKGMISKFAYDHYCPQEKKDLRTKSVESRAKK